MKREILFTLNERLEEQAATKPDILQFFGLGNFVFIRKSEGRVMSVSTIKEWRIFEGRGRVMYTG